MMMVWLIDSRSRALTGKRYVWGWEEDAGDYSKVFAEVWDVVVCGEPWAEDLFWDEDGVPRFVYSSSFEEGQEVFRRFWAEYGWELARFDETLLDGDDIVRRTGLDQVTKMMIAAP